MYPIVPMYFGWLAAELPTQACMEIVDGGAAAEAGPDSSETMRALCNS